MISKRKLILFSCAFLIGFSLCTVMVFLAPRNLFNHNNQAIDIELAINNHIPWEEISELSHSQSVNKNIKISIDSKATKKILPTNNKTPLTADFPLGWFDDIRNTNTLAEIANEGMNIVMPYVRTSNDAQIMAYLDTAEQVGIKVLLEIPRPIIKAEDTDAITQFVRKFKNHPAVVAWYSWDEPEVTRLSPKILKKAYDAIKAEDSSKPIAVVFVKLDGIEQYLDALDIFMWDKYPVTYGSPEFGSSEWSKLAAWFNRADFLSTGKNGFWFVMQGYGEKQDGTPQFNKRLPTYGEERYMLYSAVLSGANGLFLWTHYRSQQSWIDSVLTPIVREFHNYIPAIEAGKIVDRLQVDSSNVRVALYQDPTSQSYFLVAINHGKSQLNATMLFKKETRTKFARVLKEKRCVRFTHVDGKTIFRDKFNPYAVHIYDLN